MKRYIKASLSESTPDWLKKRFARGWYNDFKSNLLKRGVALDKVTYTDTPTGPNDLPIYLLQVDMGQTVYAPGVNDDASESINGRYRKLGSIAKSKLPDMAIDVVYVNLDDPANKAPSKDRYQDPRYSYRYSRKGDYMGQYMMQDWDSETHENVDVGWSDRGKTPSNETRARDKSGYKVPSPEERISEYYEKYPNKIREKVDSVYEMLLETKKILMDADFNRPFDDRFYTDNIADAYSEFSRAINAYRKLLSSLDENKNRNSIFYSRSSFGRSVSDIKSQIQKILDILER